jgi:hypothetical protein
MCTDTQSGSGLLGQIPRRKPMIFADDKTFSEIFAQNKLKKFYNPQKLSFYSLIKKSNHDRFPFADRRLFPAQYRPFVPA